MLLSTSRTGITARRTLRASVTRRATALVSGLRWRLLSPMPSPATSPRRCCTARCSPQPLTAPDAQTAKQTGITSIFDVAELVDSLDGPGADALRRLYTLTSGPAVCLVGPALSQKYGMVQDNVQTVVSVTNNATLEQCWFNEARTRKPQTFKSEGSFKDPTDGGRTCDFCNWQELTAQDGWGRIEGPHAVTGSNLFKYGEPCHGLLLFKHHDPLEFSKEQLSDFLSVAQRWFAAALAAHPAALHGMLIWNCGPRAGASQYHGHGQLMLTRVPVPAQARLDQQARLYRLAHEPAPGGGAACYFRDVIAAHAAVGLAREVTVGHDRCFIMAHMAPIKDMEIIVVGAGHTPPPTHGSPAAAPHAPHHNKSAQPDGGQAGRRAALVSNSSTTTTASTAAADAQLGLASPAFARAMHAALRALVDDLGVATFNAGVLNVVPPTSHVIHPEGSGAPSLAQQQQRATAAPSNVGVENSCSSSGDDGDGSSSSQVTPSARGGASSCCNSAAAPGTAAAAGDGAAAAATAVAGDGAGVSGGHGCVVALPDLSALPEGDWRPLFCRMVSRGKLSAQASDYGCLEVVGGASIGHTDPFTVMAAIDKQLR